MIGRLVKSGLRRCGYDVTQYPMPDWQMNRNSLATALRELLAVLQINCVIDVGANNGQYGEFLRSIGYKGRIVSFEPVSSTYLRLADKSKTDPAWQIYNMAVGRAEEILKINVMDNSVFSSLLPINAFGTEQFADQTTVTRTEEVKVVRLDSKIDEIVAGLDNPRVYLKMDTQGYDLNVIEGASGCLNSILGLQSEIALQPIYEGMPDYLTSLAKLNSLGFGVTALVPVTRDENLCVVEFDCLMVRNSHSAGQ
jgi:FkbM family methyltransferase